MTGRRPTKPKRGASAKRPTAPGGVPDADAVRLLQELRIHQIELESQNDELRRTRGQMEALLTQYSDLYDFAPAGYLTLDRAQTIQQVNLTAASYLGAARSRLARASLLTFVEPKERTAFGELIERTFASDARLTSEVTLHRAGLGPVTVQVEGTLSADGEECRLVMVDVTARRAAEATLRLQVAALDAAASGIVITDAEGLIVWGNTAFSKLTGYDLAEAVGQDPGVLVKSGVHDAAVYKQMWDTITAGQVWHGEMTNRRKDGSHYVEEMTINPIRDPDGKIRHFVANKRDLTQERELQAQFVQAQKLEGIGRLAGGLAHDFNNLLTVILGTVNLLATGLPPDSPHLEDLAQVRGAAERAARLTRQLLAFSRHQVLRPVVLDLDVVVNDTRAMLRRVIGESISLTTGNTDHPVYVLADLGHLQQVLVNLAVNSRDAMPNGGTLSITTSEADVDARFVQRHPSMIPGRYVALAVTDNGDGMDPDTLRQAFDPFYTTKPAGQGTGLGLATVYGVVKQNNGSVWIESAPGKGTTVTIYLPRVSAPTSRNTPTEDHRAVGGTETIIVVEDEAPLLSVATRILSSAGYRVLAAGAADEAIALLERHAGNVALLLTDVVMPGMNGRDLARIITRAHPEIKVLITSGYAEDPALLQGVRDHVTHFIDKPYTVAELRSAVRAALDGPA